MRTRLGSLLPVVALLLLLAGSGIAAIAGPAASIAYVAQLQGGKATAQSPGAPVRSLERFSPLFAGDVLTIEQGGKLMARFTSTGQTQTYSAADPPARRRVVAPTGPNNDVKSRLMRAVFDDQRAGLTQASRNVQGATRDLQPDFCPQLPQSKTLLRDLTFTWKMDIPAPVQITVYDSNNSKDQQIVWQSQDVTGDHMVYPADQDKLKPGVTYYWSVSRVNAADPSKRDVSPTARFMMASALEEREMTRRLDALKQMEFADAEEAAMTTAAMLLKSGLNSNALYVLAPLTDKSVSPLVHVLRLQAYRPILYMSDAAFADKKAVEAAGNTLKNQWKLAEPSSATP